MHRSEKVLEWAIISCVESVFQNSESSGGCKRVKGEKELLVQP